MALSTRDALVAAAVELMDAGGLDAVTLREVGRRAGVSHNAPYKHFAHKEALLAAVAAAEITRWGDAWTQIMARAAASGLAEDEVVREAVHDYVARAMAQPVRFKLVYRAWTTATEELSRAATTTRSLLIQLVVAAQRAGSLPGGDPERVTALLMALAHGAVDLALTGHLSPTGKGRAGPADLVDDLFRYLKQGQRGSVPITGD